jgi:flagellar biosynthesis/type III secretory pathway M-ring protein FliF/YscJ
VPSDLIVALNGLVVVFVVSIEILRRRPRAAAARAAQRQQEPQPPTAPEVTPA